MSARFLVVEDDTDYAENLSELLTLSGFSSERARTLADARRLASDRSFDVAVVDLVLPDGRGSDVIAALRERSPHVVAIVLTAQPTIGSARDAIEQGAAAYLLKDGDPRELESVIRRTAEQATLARALRESEQRYALLVERAPLGIAVVRDGRYALANERLARILGHPGAAALAAAPVDRELWRLDGEPAEETYTRTSVPRADGSLVDLMITRAPLDLDGRPAVQLIVRDVTEDRRVARALEETRAHFESSRRLAALGAMVAGIAHEIRNPLQGVAWGVNDLKSLAAASGSAALGEAVEKVEASMREIEAIVAEVLDYARPLTVERISFPIADLLESTRETVTPEAAARGVRIEVATDLAHPETSLDALRIKQALVNVVRNAVEASPRGAFVALRARNEDAKLILEVRDEGAGLPPELGESVFLPFVTTKVKATGLGLAVARRIVEAHGGVIHLEAGEPTGTIARIELPGSSA